MRFSQDVWQRNLALYHKTLALPFNQELAQGTLSKAAFAHYVIQDSHYLIAYGRALAVCAAKAFDADDIIQFANAAKIAIVVERTLHDSFMQEFDISKQEFENTPLTLACHHYTSYLVATAWRKAIQWYWHRYCHVSGFMPKLVKISSIILHRIIPIRHGLIPIQAKNSTLRLTT